MYKKGDIVIIQFPFADVAEYKKRPALIISNEEINKTGDYLMVQITSKIKNDNLSIQIQQDNYSNNIVLPLVSYIRLHKIFLLNEKLILSKATTLKSEFTDNVILKIIKLIQ